jgi:predicted nucleic-acid-binding protein
VAHGAWVAHIVLVEAMWVLSSVYKRSAQRIASAVEMLLSHRDLAIQDAETVAEAVARFRERPSVSFSDCLVLEVARKAGHSPLGTFDRGLGRLEGAQRL